MKPKNKNLFVKWVVFPIAIFGGAVFFFLPKYSLDRARDAFENQSPQMLLKKHESQLMSDRAILEEVSFFRGSLGESDAGEYLNQLVKFDGDKKEPAIKLSPDLMEKMRAKDWYKAEIDMSVYLLDFSWMGKLHDYDVWAPEIANKRISLDKRPRIFETPLPEYSELMAWARLRLIQGKQSKTLVQALQDVRQLARLIYTNDTLVSSMSAVRMLKAEAEFVKHHQTLVPEQWQVVEEDVLVRAKRYFYAVGIFVDPRLSVETYKTFASTKVGECVMVYEGMMTNHLMRDYLSEFYAPQIERFSQTLKDTRATCRLGLAQLAWEDPMWSSHEIKEGNTALGTFVLLGVAGENMLKEYDEK